MSNSKVITRLATKMHFTSVCYRRFRKQNLMYNKILDFKQLLLLDGRERIGKSTICAESDSKYYSSKFVILTAYFKHQNLDEIHYRGLKGDVEIIQVRT